MRLIDICDFQGGSQPPKKEWSFECKSGYIRMLQIRDFTQENSVIPEYVKFSPKLKTCEEDDILIGRYGASVGKILTGKSGVYNVAIMKSIPDTSKVRKEYMKYYFKSTIFQNYLLNLGGRAAQAGFSKDDLKKIDFRVIPFEEQDEVINSFSSLEKAIYLKKQVLLSMDELIKSRFIELFLSNNQFPIKKWSDVLTIYNGRDYKANLSDEINGYPVYGSGGFMNVYADKYLCEGTLTIIGRKGTIDKPILVKGKIWNIDTAFGIKTNDKILNPIFFHYRSKFYDYKGMNKQTTKPSLTKTDLLKLDIELPPIEDQLGFVSFVNQIDKSKFIVQQQIKELQELLDKKMDEYFGE